jgi:DNA replication protein DnaC
VSFQGEGSRTEDRCEFGMCDGSGFLVDETTSTATDCPCRERRITRKRTAALQGRIPKRYRGVSFDRPPVPEIARVAPDTVEGIKRYVQDVDAQLDAGKGLWLVGDVGTGKTTLAMIVSKAAIEAGRSVAIYSLPRLLNLIRAAIETEDGMMSFLERLVTVDLLHIDDLGAENTTDWVLEQLYSIVNSRYEDERAILVTTNLTFEESIEQLNERTVSRLQAICGDWLPLYGNDDRRTLRPPPIREHLPEPIERGDVEIWTELFSDTGSD